MGYLSAQPLPAVMPKAACLEIQLRFERGTRRTSLPRRRTRAVVKLLYTLATCFHIRANQSLQQQRKKRAKRSATGFQAFTQQVSNYLYKDRRQQEHEFY